jgi:ubiquinone/menaquinone biosynthesis C-methylase UbiE
MTVSKPSITNAANEDGAPTRLRDRLRASPSFALGFAFDGRAYVAKDTEPYVQYWLTERYRVLYSMFAGRRGATVGDAVDGFVRFTSGAGSAADRRRLVLAIDDMQSCGVLVSDEEDTSRYNADIVDHYLTHRPFPRALASFLVERAALNERSTVLDLAGGPGDLALQLAATTRQVSLMDLSKGFLRSARTRARKRGLPLHVVHDSANRLVHRDDAYDVITISQALHWLDDVQVCRGICRVLQPGGSFFVIQSSLALDDDHPLAPLIGSKSIFGHKDAQPFAKQIEALARRLTLLFDALDAPDVHRIDPGQRWSASDADAARIVPAGATLFRQRRSFGLGFVRAFLTPQHIESIGLEPGAFWSDWEQRVAPTRSDELIGIHDWAVLQFRRGGERMEIANLAAAPVVEIGCEAPA